MTITMHGAPITLEGTHLKVGDRIPDFTLTSNDLSPITLADTKGVRVFLTVPSLDTPVCDLEVRTFNQKLQALEGVEGWTVSMDLPFAQARWCGAHGITAMKTLSDYQDRSFAISTGTLIEGLKLHTRAVFVVNPEGEITYAEYVPEVGDQPDFDRVLSEVTALLQTKG
jgi:thiol peroxidase